MSSLCLRSQCSHRNIWTKFPPDWVVDAFNFSLNPAHGKLNKENVFSLSTFAPENLVSRDRFDDPARVDLPIVHTRVEFYAYSEDYSHSHFHDDGAQLYRLPSSGQSRVGAFTAESLPPHRASSPQCSSNNDAGAAFSMGIPISLRITAPEPADSRQ